MTERTAVTTIGETIVFKGELSGDEDLVIDGQVEGKIDLNQNALTVGEHGKVKAAEGRPRRPPPTIRMCRANHARRTLRRRSPLWRAVLPARNRSCALRTSLALLLVAGGGWL